MTGRLSLLLLLAATACRLNPDGQCEVRADCPAGLDCLNHVCSNCRGDTECWSYTFCSSAGLCELRPGRCRVDADCPTYDRCSASNTCVLRADHCANDAACTGANELCDPEHHCSLQDGRCLVNEDCDAWLASCDTAASRCLLPATAGDDVLAIGTLVEGACDRGAISRATTAAASAAVEIGLGCGSAPDGVARMDPVTGGVVYRHQEASGGDTLRRFRQDALTWDAAASLWRFPADASANDDFALVPGACPITWDRWAMQAATGKLLYACPVPGGVPPQRDFYDEADARVLQAVREVLSWNDGGYLLVVSGSGVTQVVAPGGVATAVTGLPAGTLLAVRATATGFQVAISSDVTGKDELWLVGELAGAATQSGTYADVLPGYTGGVGSVLDEAGALYGVGFRQLRAAVLKRPVTPGTTVVVYSEESIPAGSNDFAAPTFKPFLRLDGFLATRP